MDREANGEESNKNDIIWKNSELYSEIDEINAAASVLYKLFSNPKLGEHSEKRKIKPKTIAGKLF